MFELDKDNFARFLTELRKQKGYTQKQLAERLFVSDKAVSKWERSLSMPDISLLIPLAEILEVSVTELLEGRKLDPDAEMKAGKVEELVQKALNLETPGEKGKRRGKDIAVFGGCALCMVLEAAAGLWQLGRNGFGPGEPGGFMAFLGGIIVMLLLCGFGLGFGIYFWFFMKERLPRYYDENKISVYTDGCFSLSMPGVTFDNGSWPYMVKALRTWAVVTMVTAPPACLLPAFWADLLPVEWLPFCVQMVTMGLYMAGMGVPLYRLCRKYGSRCTGAEDGTLPAKDEQKETGSRKKKLLILLITALLTVLLTFLAVRIGGGEAHSGIRMGFVQRYASEEWSASYRLLDGSVSRTLYPPADEGAWVLEIETTKGMISVEMKDSAGNSVFCAGDMEPGVYRVPASGRIRVTIRGEDHEGGFSVRWE